MRAVIDGYNYVMMTYGEKGSGKSYSMIGPYWEDSIKNNALNLK